jgi:hypothetical protein
VLHELIVVRHLQLETGELLIQICVLLLRFSARHLQHDEALLGTLLGGVDTQLQTVAMALNLLAAEPSARANQSWCVWRDKRAQWIGDGWSSGVDTAPWIGRV